GIPAVGQLAALLAENATAHHSPDILSVQDQPAGEGGVNLSLTMPSPAGRSLMPTTRRRPEREEAMNRRTRPTWRRPLAIAGEARGLDEMAAVAAPVDGSVLRQGLDALAAGDIDGARGVRDGEAGDALDRRILAWAIALDGGRAVTAAEIAEAA